CARGRFYVGTYYPMDFW
nr:immunoglobulin heavy chain junction region [Mus musculus]MBK4185498.1 immunoglobulin heavy chain junction region [Mus musculus]